ncbi:urate oxidase [Arthrobacter stackebrandtii]|uniref:Uricase n=1 Tax=Arthrobacter stackebrandtii TaxID=272161 RepID=A0ABS4YW52_9MICC|nr:urate oxidase [Arthrobacter stackebrandtii]MBP2413011.1 urate oxidase [Arthrobacter stackebrandtii]PYH01204.1 urate oxidase [Arthrobacter stackebrandtii]
MNQNNIILGANQFGKAEVRLVKITRDTARHAIEDLNVTSQLRGDFLDAHLLGDNAHVVPTDTQKNTVYALAREGVGSPEEFLLRLGEHFTTEFSWVDGGRWAAEQYGWDRIQAHGQPHDHAFVRNGQEVRTAVVVKDGPATQLIAGLHSLTVLKSTGSGFEGFPVDKYTTLAPTDDRIMSTDVAARWRYNPAAVEGLDFNKAYDDVKALLLEGFTENYSTALQQTMFNMGRKVLEAHPEIDEIKFSMPNKHHFVVDLAPFGLDNPNEVFFAADRPYGLIEAAVLRENASDAGRAWEGIAGFC